VGLVVILCLELLNPTEVLGPVLLDTVSESCSPIKDFLTGEYPLCPKLCWNVVDVRDVAIAHIRAMETPTANGRYLLTNGNMWFIDMCNVLRDFYPDYPIPKYNLPNILGYLIGIFDPRITVTYLWYNLGQVRTFNNKKSIEELSLNYRPLEQTILDCGKSIVDKNIIRKPSGSSVISFVIPCSILACLIYFGYKKKIFQFIRIKYLT